MKTILKYLSVITFLALIHFSAKADDLGKLSGKWMVEKENTEGQKYKQVLEFKEKTFKFWIKSPQGQTMIYAEGAAKIQKVNDLHLLMLKDIKAGESETNISAIYDDRTIVYRMGYKAMTVATNFESSRDEDPEIDIYKKVE